MGKNRNSKKQQTEATENKRYIGGRIEKVNASVVKLISETKETKESLRSVEMHLNKENRSSVLKWVVSLTTLVVAIVALIVSCSAFSMERKNYTAIVNFDEAEMRVEENPLIFHFSVSQGNIAKGYYAMIVEENIEYRIINLEGRKGNSFTVNLEEMMDEYNKNKQIQFALVLYDNNGDATIRYYSRMHLDELEGTALHYTLTNNTTGDIVASGIHNWSDNLVAFDCTLCNEYTIRKRLEEESMRTRIIMGGKEIHMKHLSAEVVYSFIEQIRADVGCMD